MFHSENIINIFRILLEKENTTGTEVGVSSSSCCLFMASQFFVIVPKFELAATYSSEIASREETFNVENLSGLMLVRYSR